MKSKTVILIAFIFSGAAALIFQVAWVRPIEFILGSTVHTVSIIFAAFMIGLSFGSWVISKYVDRISNVPKAYALMELGIGVYGILLLFIFNAIPDVYRLVYQHYANFYLFEFFQFLLIFIILLIPTALMGATFPVVAKYYSDERIGKGIGEVYSANNIGAIAGSFFAGFLLIPLLGIKMTIVLAGSLNIAVSFIILSIFAKEFSKKAIPAGLVLFLLFSYFGNYNIEQLYYGGFYRAGYAKELLKETEFLYYKEGLHAAVAVVKDPLDGVRGLLINGKGQGSTAFSDLRVNLLLAYSPIMVNPHIEKALVIGLGTGVTSGHLSQLMEVTTVEIEPAILSASAYFNDVNLDVLDNKNHHVVIADGRNYLLKNKETFDLIIPEPSDPWQSFSTALFSKEFMELAKNSLSEDGVYVQWAPIYQMDVDDFKSFYRTFVSVFPHVIGLVNVRDNENLPRRVATSEIILLGSLKAIPTAGELKINFENVPLDVRKDYLSAVWIRSADDFLNLVLFTGTEMEGYANQARFVTDDNALLEFSTARNFFVADRQAVLSDIKNFLGSPER